METNQQIYVQRAEQQHGPYSRRLAKAMLKDGSLSPDDLAWQEGIEEWQRLGDLLAPKEAKEGGYSPNFKIFIVLGIPFAAFVFCFLWFKGVFNEPAKTPPLSRADKELFGMTEGRREQAQRPSREGTKSPTKSRESSPKTESRETPALSPQDQAKQYARAVILKKLKAPATAKFVELRIVTEEDPWFQVYALVDAQNSFGALIRSHFLCAIKLGDDGRFGRSVFGTWEEDDDWKVLSESKLELHRKVNHWGD